MSRVGEIDPDVMDCGGPMETWQEMSKHLRWRACNSRVLARESRQAAEDAAQSADYFAEQAESFDALASALENANVTFPALAIEAAIADETTKIGSTEGESAGPKDNAQNMSGPSHE